MPCTPVETPLWRVLVPKKSVPSATGPHPSRSEVYRAAPPRMSEVRRQSLSAGGVVFCPRCQGRSLLKGVRFASRLVSCPLRRNRHPSKDWGPPEGRSLCDSKPKWQHPKTRLRYPRTPNSQDQTVKPWNQITVPEYQIQKPNTGTKTRISCWQNQNIKFWNQTSIPASQIQVLIANTNTRISISEIKQEYKKAIFRKPKPNQKYDGFDFLNKVFGCSCLGFWKWGSGFDSVIFWFRYLVSVFEILVSIFGFWEW